MENGLTNGNSHDSSTSYVNISGMLIFAKIFTTDKKTTIGNKLISGGNCDKN